MLVVATSLTRAARPVAAAYASDSAFTSAVLLLVGLFGCLFGLSASITY
jgi:hypothetical protein